MIIVLFSGNAVLLKKAYEYIENQHPGYCAKVCLASVENIELRMQQLSQIPDRATEHRVSVVLNPKTAQELSFLRGIGAVVCHQYGPLSAIYDQEISIAPQDVLYVNSLTAMNSPAHVLCIHELLSECKIKHRKSRLRG